MKVLKNFPEEIELNETTIENKEIFSTCFNKNIRSKIPKISKTKIQ